jgi:hypothetical protein
VSRADLRPADLRACRPWGLGTAGEGKDRRVAPDAPVPSRSAGQQCCCWRRVNANIDGVSPVSRRSDRPRRPALFGPSVVDSLMGAPDPAERIEAAHATAEALVRHGRSGGDEVAARLVHLTDEHGIDEVAALWSDRPADSLPGALWRLYALRAGIRRDPSQLARAFEVGRHRAPVHEAVAGVGDPPGPGEVMRLADAVLTGAFSGDLDVALERAGAFCRVVSTGWALIADDTFDTGRAAGLTRRAADLQRTGAQLETAAACWRKGTLH